MRPSGNSAMRVTLIMPVAICVTVKPSGTSAAAAGSWQTKHTSRRRKKTRAGASASSQLVLFPKSRITGHCLKSLTTGLDTVSTGSGSDLLSDKHAKFPDDS
jgi:hypothetical protein